MGARVNDDDESIRNILRGAGLRSTRARVAAYQLLQAAPSPMSHSEVFERLTCNGFDKATVFRNLNDFAEAGLASRTELGDHVWRFELVAKDHGKEAHPHFICIECGTVQCVDNSELIHFADRPGIVAIGSVTEVLLRGCCRECQG